MSDDMTPDVIAEIKGKSTSKMAQIVYILYLVAIIFPITNLVGVIMAYINKGDSPEWIQTHYQFQIRTFWIAFLIGFIGAFTAAFGVGVLVLLGLLVWYVVRCVKGMKYLDQKIPVPDPKTWLW